MRVLARLTYNKYTQESDSRPWWHLLGWLVFAFAYIAAAPISANYDQQAREISFGRYSVTNALVNKLERVNHRFPDYLDNNNAKKPVLLVKRLKFKQSRHRVGLARQNTLQRFLNQYSPYSPRGPPCV